MPVGAFVPSELEYDYPRWTAPAIGSTDTGKAWAWNHATNKYEPATFLLSSAVSVYGLTLASAADAAAARTALALGTSATLNVGTGANNIVQLDSSSRLPAVDGSQLTGVVAAASPGGSTTQVQYNNAGAFTGDAGLTYNASTDRLTVVGGIVAGDWSPPSDSTTAMSIWNAARSARVVTVDTTNGWVKIGTGAVASLVRPLTVAHPTQPELIIHNTTSGQQWGLAAFGDFTINDRAGNTTRFAIAPSGGFDFRNAGNSKVFSISGTGLLGVIQPITVTVANNYGFYARSSGAGNFTGVSIGRTANDGILAVVSSAGGFSAGSIVGDLVLRGDAAGLNLTVANNSGEIRFAAGSAANLRTYMSNAGLWSFGAHGATALVDIDASTTDRASLRVRAGTAPTTPNAGDIYFNGTNFFGYNGSAWKQLDN